MGDTNFFATRDQYVLICYTDIIKMTYPVMLKKLIDDYYDDLIQYFELDKIKDYDIYNLERLCVERTYKNPLRYLKRDECSEETCDVLLNAFEEEMIEMYTKSKFSEFGGKLYNVLFQPFIKEVYIYTEKPIEQILYDCKVHFNEFDDKIKYIGGDFIEMVKSLPHRPTSYILNDVNYIQDLIDNDLIEYTEIMIGELGYNFELDENYELQVKNKYDTLMEEKVFKFGIIPIVKLEQKHFTCLKHEEL